MGGARREVTCSAAGGWLRHQTRPALASGTLWVQVFFLGEKKKPHQLKRKQSAPENGRGAGPAAALVPGTPGGGPARGHGCEIKPRAEAEGFSRGTRDPSPGSLPPAPVPAPPPPPAGAEGPGRAGHRTPLRGEIRGGGGGGGRPIYCKAARDRPPQRRELPRRLPPLPFPSLSPPLGGGSFSQRCPPHPHPDPPNPPRRRKAKGRI